MTLLLKVYAAHPTYQYAGGLVLVAAPSRAVARKVLDASDDGKQVSGPYLLRGVYARGKARVLISAIYIE